MELDPRIRNTSSPGGEGWSAAADLLMPESIKSLAFVWIGIFASGFAIWHWASFLRSVPRLSLVLVAGWLLLALLGVVGAGALILGRLVGPRDKSEQV